MSNKITVSNFGTVTVLTAIATALAVRTTAAVLFGPVVPISTPDPFAACGSY